MKNLRIPLVASTLILAILTPLVFACSPKSVAQSIDSKSGSTAEKVDFMRDGGHEIDDELHRCLEQAGGDFGERMCLNTALAAWKEQLKQLLADGRKTLKGNALKAFEASQSAWESYLNSAKKQMELQLEGLEGTMYERYRIEEELGMVRARALQLEHGSILFEEP